jgi:hypothetical protein
MTKTIKHFAKKIKPRGIYAKKYQTYEITLDRITAISFFNYPKRLCITGELPGKLPLYFIPISYAIFKRLYDTFVEDRALILKASLDCGYIKLWNDCKDTPEAGEVFAKVYGTNENDK